MSRIIVKNLPKNCSEDAVRKHFKEFGPLTDVSLKYTKEGVFRKFAFVGFASEDTSEKVIKHFHQSFFGTSRIAVEVCAPIEEKNKIRPWSKHSKGSTAYKRLHGDDSVLEESSVKKPKRSTHPVLQKYAGDPLFNEFLKVSGVKLDEDEAEVEPDSNGELLQAIQNYKGDPSSSLIFRGLPPNLKQTNLKEWLSPIRMQTCFLTRSAAETFAIVSFTRPADLKKALQRTDQFLGGYKVRICKYPVKEEKKKEDELEDLDVEAERKKITDKILETGRLFLRNLPYICTEEDLTFLLKKFGEVVDVQCVVNRQTGQCKGFAVATFMFPENALSAYTQLDGTVFKGRMLHILPGEEKPDEASGQEQNQEGLSAFQRTRNAKRKEGAGKAFSWNTLFLGANAVADTLAEKLNMGKADFLEGDNVNSAAVRMSLAETRLVRETRDFLVRNGVSLDAFSRPAAKRSGTVIIAKNLPADVDPDELRRMFERFGQVKRFLLPPECKVTALVEMNVAADAKKAFTSLAYSRYKTQPLYLEWAPVDVFADKTAAEETAGSLEQKVEEEAEEKPQKLSKKEKRARKLKQKYGDKFGDDDTAEDTKLEPKEEADAEEEQMELTEPVAEDAEETAPDEEPGKTLFIKNLNFNTTDAALKAFFARSYKISAATISKKSASAKADSLLSMGFGFVTFKSVEQAEKALRNHQGALLDGHALELRRSRRADPSAAADAARRTEVVATEQGDCTKILVRNLPFQASEKEVRALFAAFGDLKTVRLPKKITKGGQHRGFAFVDYGNKADAKAAFDSLVHSTHLYGRRLVLEWAKQADTLDSLRTRTLHKFSGAEHAIKATRRQVRNIVQDGMEAASKE